MGLKDFFLGSKPSYTLLPGMQDSIDAISGMDYNRPSYLHKLAKGQLKRLDRGDDVSDIGEFASLRQNQAADLSDIDLDYSTGANVLNAAGGGEQANQINAMRDRAKERRREDTGRQYVNALSDLRRSATGTLQQENAMRDENLWRQQQMLLQARGNVYNNQRSGGILPGLIQGAAGVGLGLLTGGASAALPVGSMSTSRAIGMSPSIYGR